MMNDGAIKQALTRYIVENGTHPEMFFGVLKQEASDFWVKDVVSTDGRGGQSIRVVDKEALGSVGKYIDSYVCVTGDEINGQRLYIDVKQESPVQIIPWEYFKESKTQDANKHLSLLDYFCDASDSSKTLTCTAVPIIGGTKENPGHIIIYEGDSGGNEVFLKGFFNDGDGRIQFSSQDLRIWGKWDNLPSVDFLDVVNFNQSALMQWAGKWFLMLVPRFDVFANIYMRRGEHSVLDYSVDNASGKCGWRPLTFVKDNENSKGTDGVDIDTDQVHLGNRTTADGPMVGEEIADAVGEQNLKGGQNEEEESQGSLSATQKINKAAIGGQVQKNGHDEEEFLRKLIRVAEECGYEYDSRDLVRFHTSVKIGGFTVLGGAPGCGKSSLVALYARALLGKNKLEEDDSYLTIDVSPSWMEPEDVLGHWGLQDKYVCSQTGLVKFLRKAADSENGFPTMPIVCLEEMNLARVEHYFADFMQQLCRGEDERVLRGVPKDDSQQEPLKAFLPLSPSLRFVGTNNFDQTTQRFSPRFYDRSNYIELVDARKSEPFSKDVPSFKADFGSQVNRKTYESWFNKTPSHSILKPVVVDKYNSLTEVFKNVNLPVSRRVEVAILVYIANRPFLSECSDDPSNMDACQMRALDEVIAQKILSRYTSNSYSVDAQSEQRLEEALKNDLPLSYELFKRRCGRERPSRS